jgi:predicted enzyme related to lactoylglutathione lyase
MSRRFRVLCDIQLRAHHHALTDTKDEYHPEAGGAILAPRMGRNIFRIGAVMSHEHAEQKNYQMPPQDGFTVTHFLTVADIERSLRFYETVFGGRVLSRGDSKGAPGYIQIANTWLIVNVGGGPTPDKPTVTLSVPADPDRVSSFMNIRVADIQACYELWKGRGATFITEPKDKYGETRCYIRDPDGYIIEVGQSKPDFTYG